MKKVLFLLALLLSLATPAQAKIYLDATTDNVQIVLGGAITTNQLQCFSSWSDYTTTTSTPGKTVTNTNNTTDVNIVPAPGASTQREVDFISVYNKDTVASTVTIKFDANGTEYILFKGSIQTGERVEYSDKEGFRVLSEVGAVKYMYAVGTPTVNTLNTVTLSSDVVNNNVVANTIADVTGLSFSVTNGYRYWFRFSIPFTSAAATTGSRWSITGPAASFVSYTSRWSLAATTTTDGNYSAYDFPAASSGTSPADLVGVAWIEGVIVPSADGTVIARFASEVTSSAITAKKGAVLQWIQVATS